MLLVVQAVGVAIGAVPVFLLARKHLGGEWVGALLRARLPALPADPVARGRRLPSGRARDAAPARGDLVPRRGPPAAVRALRRRRVPDQGAGRARRRDARHLARVRARTEAGGARHLRRRRGRGGDRNGRRSSRTTPREEGRRSPGRYDAVGGSPAGIVKTAVLHPLRAPPGRVRAPRPRLPLGSARPARRPAAARSARRAQRRCPRSSLNVLSSTPTQTSIHYHYTAGAIPGLIAGAVLGGARLRSAAAASGGRGWAAASSRSSLVAGIVHRAAARSGATCRSARSSPRATTSSASTTAPRRASIRAVPGRRAVSATNKLGAHLSERRRIFSFPVLRRGALGGGRPDAAELPRRRDAAGQFAARVRAARGGTRRWRVVCAEDGVIVLHKVRRVGSLRSGSSGAGGTRRARARRPSRRSSSSAAARGTAQARYQTAR